MAGSELYDCPWCGSAKSIDYAVCQVCLMEFPVDTKVITLPAPKPVSLPPSFGTGLAEAE